VSDRASVRRRADACSSRAARWGRAASALVREMSPRSRSFAAVAVLSLLAFAPAQEKPPPKDEEEVQKAQRVDPYTGGEAPAMAAAGIVAYAPFPWADGYSTADIERVLGERRVLWVETAHFKLGLGLRSAPWPEEQEPRKALQEEIKQLRKKLPKVAEKPKRIDSWLRLHLYAQRLEASYADFQKLIGVTDADFQKGTQPREGAYLGLPGKFLVLLFQRQSDMGRYMDRFCGRKNDSSMRFYHEKSFQMESCVAAEALEGYDEAGLHGHVIYSVFHNLLNGYNGFHYPLPLWLDEGLAHWYARKVPTDTINVQILDSEAVAEDKQNDWPVKVRRRAQHQAAVFPFEAMAKWEKWEEMGYHAHAQSWSRVDYLMQADADKVGLMVRHLKGLPVGAEGYEALGALARTTAQKLLFELFELDGPTFDTKWRDWVLKTYPKK
jgi:hypothetical protein